MTLHAEPTLAMRKDRSLGPAVVVDNREVARSTVILRLSFEMAAPVSAGQFAMLHPLRAGCILPRPFSILTADAGGFEVLVKRVGKGSDALADLRPGDEIRAFAPLGNGFDLDKLLGKPSILVAGGVGLVPLHMLGRSLLAGSAPPGRFIFGAQTPDDLPRELLAGTDWEVWVEEDATGELHSGRVTAGLEEALQDLPDAMVISCGPTPMMKAVGAIASGAGRRVLVCLEEQMGCGSGVCRACVIPASSFDRMLTVCNDGPVFSIDQIDFLTTTGAVS